LAARKVAAPAKVAMFTVAGGAEVTGDQREPVLRVIGRNDRLAGFTADYLAAQYRNKRIGVVRSNGFTSFGRRWIANSPGAE
jgi:hypothetical protein